MNTTFLKLRTKKTEKLSMHKIVLSAIGSRFYGSDIMGKALNAKFKILSSTAKLGETQNAPSDVKTELLISCHQCAMFHFPQAVEQEENHCHIRNITRNSMRFQRSRYDRYKIS